MGTIRRASFSYTFHRFDTRTLCTRTWLAILVFLLCMITGSTVAQDSTAAQEPNAKNVLVLFSTIAGDPAFLDQVESTIRTRVPGPITFYDAYLEHDHLTAKRKLYQDSEAETFRREFAGVKLDLVIAVSPDAIQLAERYRDKIFPGTPIVFTQVRDGEPGVQMGPGITGYTISPALRDTIDLALRLQPDTTAVAVISGVSEWHNYWLGVAHTELVQHEQVKEIDFIGPPSRELLQKVFVLPPHTVVLFQLAPQVSSHPAIGTWDVLDAIAQRLPTYSAWDSLCLNHGCIGGAYGDHLKDAAVTGEIAARVLSGERAEDIPVVHQSYLRATVDWRALRRWHIPESALPPGSVILYRPPTFWEQYRKYLIVAIALIAVLALLIVGLLWQRARRRKAEAVMREAEGRFRVMADSTPSLVWMCDPHGKITYLNERRMAFTGPDLKAGYGDSWAAYVHPDDVKGILDRLSQALKDRQPFSMEYRLRRSDGVHRRMFDVASPRVNGDGSFAGFIGSAIDITDQKLAQQALEKVSGQLIEAQEKERSRIARDLHDDICQRLALLSVELEQAKRSSDGTPAATKQRLQEIQQHCSEIANDVQSLSHQLHSSRLDYLGIVAAIRGFCKEFAKQHEVEIDFKDEEVPAHLPKDVSLCLFRVAQEALQNALKYSGTSWFAVEMRGTSEEVQLVVKDAGAGFDVEEARRNRGLGLVSMQERVNLVHGRLSVESKPGAGTKIVAAVPVVGTNGFSADEGSVQSAGMTRIK
jgi:PAS domain S-box-containing protein